MADDKDIVIKSEPGVEENPIVEDTTTTSSPTNQVDVIMNLENLIKSHITGVDSRKTELKKNKEMVEDILNNDSTYKLHCEEAKKAAKVKSQTKHQIMQQPNARALGEKVKELSTEIKEMNQALSDYLREFQRMTGTNEIEGEDGEMREIVYVAKLIKKTKKPA